MTNTPQEEIKQLITNIIEKETTDENGLLTDVDEVVTDFHSLEPFQNTRIWIREHPTKEHGEKGISNKVQLSVDYEFICLAYNLDQAIASKESYNIASRIIPAIQKNYTRKHKLFNFIKYNLIEQLPDGELQILQQQELYPGSSTKIRFIYEIDLGQCIKILEPLNSNTLVNTMVAGYDATIKTTVTNDNNTNINEGKILLELTKQATTITGDITDFTQFKNTMPEYYAGEKFRLVNINNKTVLSSADSKKLIIWNKTIDPTQNNTITATLISKYTDASTGLMDKDGNKILCYEQGKIKYNDTIIQEDFPSWEATEKEINITTNTEQYTISFDEKTYTIPRTDELTELYFYTHTIKSGTAGVEVYLASIELTTE